MDTNMRLSFELNEEMLEILAESFSPRGIAEKLADEIKGKSPDQISESGGALFSAYGRQWGERTVELGHEYSDRTYEVLKEAVEKTGTMTFPLMLQRFIEIGYLSTQDLTFLPVIENTASALIFRISDCKIYEAIKEISGEETARCLVCKQGCLTFCRTLAEALNLKDLDVAMSAKTPDQGFCEFKIENRKA